MKSIFAVTVVLSCLLPASVACAHPGHGAGPGDSWLHYILEPAHGGGAIVLLLAAACMMAAARRFLKVR